MLSRLFEPIYLGPISLPNRVVMTAVNLNYTPGGEVTRRFIEFYRARARAGTGLIIVGGGEINDQAAGQHFSDAIEDGWTLAATV